MTKYKVRFEVYNSANALIRKGSMSVKSDSELGAKVRADRYLEANVAGYHHVVITECEQDIISFFNDLWKK